MTLRYATTAGLRGHGPVRDAPPAQPGSPARRAAALRAHVVRDLRGRAGRGPRVLRFTAGDIVVVSGLPGSGKSTLIARAAPAHAVDSQDARDRWAARLPRSVPYLLYRPLVRLAHYWGLRRVLRSGASVVVHDCGTQAWVRARLARHARRRGRGLHLVLLDVSPRTAREGQRARGRGVSGYAFARHRRAVRRLLRDISTGLLPRGCASAVLLDRDAAGLLARITFADAQTDS